MSRVSYTNNDVNLLGRIMRAEAQGEGAFGMQLVGNVIINRVVCTCKEFRRVDTINEAVYQKGQFEGVGTPLFQAQANGKERKMALNCIKYWRADPAYKALYFQNPGKGKPCKNRFWGKFSGRFKNHCFYNLDDYKGCSL